CARDRGSLDVW
nr:immunoglobulin heavy chain junction region [Macaca mulatta]MOW86769.1 immunoglobulin heavy chain junction region [Macaca mulatta]MOW87004.1 immunoglobulin heavy chain junction region [Macaca mulatta]MOW87189.1 immunoglobulin heavy chain junction region [Macaca mulatta]MOW87301.1 immunoglobulin heavy chain junction region [Macaca mulatta]